MLGKPLSQQGLSKYCLPGLRVLPNRSYPSLVDPAPHPHNFGSLHQGGSDEQVLNVLNVLKDVKTIHSSSCSKLHPHLPRHQQVPCPERPPLTSSSQNCSYWLDTLSLPLKDVQGTPFTSKVGGTGEIALWLRELWLLFQRPGFRSQPPHSSLQLSTALVPGGPDAR